MGVRYFCDRCEKEFKSNGLVIETYARDALGMVMAYMGKALLCEACTKKFDMVKDRLKYEEDFFTMTDEDISLMEYDFKVGDEVITSTGQFGVITEICNCDLCRDRGFYELKVEVTLGGLGTIHITDNDKRVNFRSFYQIGKYKFGNIDKDCVEHDIELETHKIEEATKNIATYQEQLRHLNVLENLDIKNKK